MIAPDKVAVTVLIPFDSYEKLLLISRMGNTPVSDVASQAVQEWIIENYGKRYPSDS